MGRIALKRTTSFELFANDDDNGVLVFVVTVVVISGLVVVLVPTAEVEWTVDARKKAPSAPTADEVARPPETAAGTPDADRVEFDAFRLVVDHGWLEPCNVAAR